MLLGDRLPSRLRLNAWPNVKLRRLLGSRLSSRLRLNAWPNAKLRRLLGSRLPSRLRLKAWPNVKLSRPLGSRLHHMANPAPKGLSGVLGSQAIRSLLTTRSQTLLPPYTYIHTHKHARTHMYVCLYVHTCIYIDVHIGTILSTLSAGYARVYIDQGSSVDDIGLKLDELSQLQTAAGTRIGRRPALEIRVVMRLLPEPGESA